MIAKIGQSLTFTFWFPAAITGTPTVSVSRTGSGTAIATGNAVGFPNTTRAWTFTIAGSLTATADAYVAVCTTTDTTLPVSDRQQPSLWVVGTPVPAAQTGDAMTLTSDYDAAKTAASQASVDAVAAAAGVPVDIQELDLTGIAGDAQAAKVAAEAAQVAAEAIVNPGVGPNTVTVTVTNSATAAAIGSAAVALGTLGAMTNASGVAVFHCETGAFMLAISKGGFQHEAQSVPVSGDMAVAALMEPRATPPGHDPHSSNPA
jgi:hypothetical protein